MFYFNKNNFTLDFTFQVSSNNIGRFRTACNYCNFQTPFCDWITSRSHPSKSIPFSDLPKKVLDRKPFGQGNPCKIQGINPGQAIENAGNNQNICSKHGVLIPPQSDGHFAPSKKPLIFVHIKCACQSNALLAHTNHTYLLCGLFIFLVVLRCQFDPCSRATNENKPFKMHIRTMVYCDSAKRSLGTIMPKKNQKMTPFVYGTRNHCLYTYTIRYYGFNSLIRQRGSGVRPGMYMYVYKI